MGLLDDVKGMLTQYASGTAPSGDAGTHFQQVAKAVDAGTVAAQPLESIRAVR